MDRTHLNSIIKENKLSATGLIDPATARKLGEIIGVQALITGTLTPFGENVRVAVKVLDTATAEVIDATRGNIAKTQGIEELLDKTLMVTQKKTSEPAKTDADEKESVISKVDKGGLTFGLLGCSVSGKRVKCSLLITSKGKDMTLRLGYGGSPKSRLFDHQGNEYSLSEVQLANKTARHDVEGFLVADVQTKSALSFEGFSSKKKRISLFEVEARADGSDVLVKFRDIPLLTE